MRRRSNAAQILLLWLCGTAPVQALDAASELKAHLSELDSISSQFEQVTIGRNNRVVQHSTGSLWVDRNNRFRIETAAPFPQVLVSNGKDFWSYDEDLAQVVVRELNQSAAEVPILLLGGRADEIIEAYEVNRFADDDQVEFVLTPLNPARLFETFAITFKRGLPTAISITDGLGQRTHINLSNTRTNQNLADDHFTLAIPEGADVIDDRITLSTADGESTS